MTADRYHFDSEPDDNAPVEHPIKGRNQFELLAGALVVIIAIGWLIGFIDRVIMPLAALSGVEIRVPDLRHQPYEVVDSLCRAAGLELARGRMRVDNHLLQGTVLDQYPMAGVPVKPGRRVEVVVSTRERMVVCPDVVGRSPREAMLMANSLGLVVLANDIHYGHSSSFPEGVVMAQRPLPMTGMMRGDELVLTVSLGPNPTEITAPELVGRRISQAGIILARQNLRLGEVTRHPTSSVPAGTILSQSPAPGSPMEPGEKVSLNVAMEPVNSPVKDKAPDEPSEKSGKED